MTVLLLIKYTNRICIIKKKWASTHKAYNIKMTYKPTLEVAEDFVIIEGHKIKHYIVTGEFLLNK